MKKERNYNYDVVIVNYNGEKIIAECLQSLYQSSVLPKKIIIYDNNSNDNSKITIAKNFPKVIIVEGNKNIGFGRANNRAMRKSDSEFILFMNNDLILDKKCAEILLDNFDRKIKKLVIINPIIYKGWQMKKNQEIYAFGAEINQNGFGYGLYDMSPDRTDLNCFSGACFMAQSHIIKKLKFEERFFLYCEEPELSARMLKRRLKIGRVSRAKCYHLESYSSPANNIDGIVFRQYYGVQNRWFMIGKHWPIRKLPIVFIFNFLHLLYILYFYLRTKKFCYLKIFYRAHGSLIRGLLSRDQRKTFDSLWYKKLNKTSIVDYIKLGKKVFTNSIDFDKNE